MLQLLLHCPTQQQRGDTTTFHAVPQTGSRRDLLDREALLHDEDTAEAQYPGERRSLLKRCEFAIHREKPSPTPSIKRTGD